MEIDVQKFQKKTEDEINNYKTLQKVLTDLYNAEVELNKKRNEAFDNIGKIEEKNNELKGKVYDKFSSKMKSLEDIKNDKIGKIKSKLIPTTDSYINEAKKTKQKIGNFKSMKSSEQNQKKEIEKLKKSGADISENENELQNKRSVIKSMGDSLEDEIMIYETNRIENNKLIMLHLINYEMAYHAQAIETLTQLFKDVKSSKPKASINPLLQSMGVSQQVVDSDDNQEENEEEDEEEDNKQKSQSKKKKITKKK
jgi:hypothetical protein